MDSIKAIFLFYLIYRIIFYSNFDLFCGLNIFNSKMRTGVKQEERVYNGYNFSYSSPEDSWFKRKIISTIENLTGKPELQRIYNELHDNHPDPYKVWKEILDSIKHHMKTYLWLNNLFDNVRLKK